MRVWNNLGMGNTGQQLTLQQATILRLAGGSGDDWDIVMVKRVALWLVRLVERDSLDSTDMCEYVKEAYSQGTAYDSSWPPRKRGLQTKSVRIRYDDADRAIIDRWRRKHRTHYKICFKDVLLAGAFGVLGGERCRLVAEAVRVFKEDVRADPLRHPRPNYADAPRAFQSHPARR